MNLRDGLLCALLGQYRWYRRLAGGHWERWIIDAPICAELWFPRDTCGDPPGLGRGRPTCEDWSHPPIRRLGPYR